MSAYDSVGGASANNTIYHDKSPAVVIFSKAYAVVAVLMVLLAVAIAIWQVHRDWAFSLLIINLAISSSVTFFLMWWYNNGDLDSGKLWFVFVTAGILIFQSLTTIIYVLAHKTFVGGDDPSPAFTMPTPAFTMPTPATVKTPPGSLWVTGETPSMVPHG